MTVEVQQVQAHLMSLAYCRFTDPSSLAIAVIVYHVIYTRVFAGSEEIVYSCCALLGVALN